VKEIVSQRGERPPAPSPPSRGRRLRIVSANLLNGGADPGAFAELIDRLAADVVATQEMSPEQADALARVLPHGRLEPARNFTGMGIALREPAKVRLLELPLRSARVVDLQWPQPSGAPLELEVCNVHVQAPHSPPHRYAFGYRRGQLHGLLRHLQGSPQRRRVVIGDFNATPLWPVYRRLAAHLTDAALVAARRHGRSVRPTWGPWPGAPRLLRIDHAFVHGVVVEDFQVLPVAGGDHSAIVVDLIAPLAVAPAAIPAQALA
jgi:endonuclease/exonuclease/phosphatase (EEP) superfamily protein YafD